MNDMTVGMENLPNVFIDKISVLPTSNPELIKIHTKLCLYDHKDSPSWRNRGEFSLKLHVAYESVLGKIDQLNNGLMSLYKHKSNIENIDPSIRSITMGMTPEGMDGEYEKYSIVVKRILKRSRDLNIYAACFVDDLGFDTPMFNKFYGPMSAERVFVGGRLNTLSNYFYYPDTNEEYGGPVHQKPDGSYMEGSEHNQQSHKEVRLVSEENYKVQAFNFELEKSIGEIGDVDSAGNLRDFLGTDRQAGRPGLLDREYDPQSITESTGPTLFDPNAANTAQQPNFNLVGNLVTTNKPTGS